MKHNIHIHIYNKKENKRLRENGKKDYNESVRKLILFVKRRDARMIEHIKEEKRLQKEKSESHQIKKNKERLENIKLMEQDITKKGKEIRLNINILILA